MLPARVLKFVMFLVLAACTSWLVQPAPARAQDAQRPNILWITCEDISPNLGCFGDDYAVTPHLDRLATEGVRYMRAFAPIGVCAPARSCLITGMYPPSLGTQHMRCQGTLPSFVRCFPEYLRKAGYYCTNNSKTDYNFKHPKSVWDESSRKAHWRNRDADQPFFAVFNFTTCHESQIRLPEAAYHKRTADFTEQQRHDPEDAPVPPYHPNTPEVRNDWARYADMITYMDMQVGDLLQQLEEDGLNDETIVFYFSDHGAGMPRDKRWLYDSSTLVPMIVRFPEKYRSLAPGAAGETTDRLVNFVDFGPTVMSLVGIDIPDHIQGKPFLGTAAVEPRHYVHGFRDRMDERYDMIRSVRDQRFKYIRNFMPHRPYFHEQRLDYLYQMPTMQVWQRLSDAGELTGAPAVFMTHTKPVEELYDTLADPFEVNNLADQPQYAEDLTRLREEQRRWSGEIRDLGFLPEADMRTRFGETPEYEAVREHPESYPLDRIRAAAELATGPVVSIKQLTPLLKDEDPAVRYWAVTGLAILSQKTPGVIDSAALKPLRDALDDPAPMVRVVAAEAVAQAAEETDAAAIDTLVAAVKDDDPWLRLWAVNALDRLDEKAYPALPVLKQYAGDSNKYVGRIIQWIQVERDQRSAN
jgi:uncharacterized sulfatase